jgi:hypothetical protein
VRTRLTITATHPTSVLSAPFRVLMTLTSTSQHDTRAPALKGTFQYRQGVSSLCRPARMEAMAQIRQIASGENLAEERATRRAALMMRELCNRYKTAVENGLSRRV